MPTSTSNTHTAVTSGDFWWTAPGELVEPANEQRGGISGVYRIVDPQSGVLHYVKRQSNHLFRDLRHPLPRPTLLREWKNMRRCAALGVPTAVPVFFDMRHDEKGWHAVLVTRDLGGYISLENALRHGRLTPDQQSAALASVAHALLPLHKARRKHGHLYPKEVFINISTVPTRTAVVDWELSRYRFSRSKAAETDLRRLLRSLVQMGLPQAKLTAVVDLYREHGIGLPHNFIESCTR